MPGSGDSAGNPRDPDLLQAWTQAVVAAAAWLRAASGAPRIVAAGVGLGGLVSYRAVCERAPIDDLVLWAVPAGGRALVRELRALSRLGVSGVFRPGVPKLPPSPDGTVLAAGYLLSGETAAALEALDLTELSLPDAERRRVLLLGRPGLNVDDLLRGSLERAGAEVTTASGPGYRAIGDVFERVDSWLAGGKAHRERLAATLEARVPERPFPSEADVPSSHEHLRLSCAGGELRETPVWVDRPSGRLFGILAEPLEAPEQLCAVLLNPHRGGHLGPSRMWVEIARRWAPRGVPSLRIDASRQGDICAALDMLRARRLPARFVLLGVCAASGMMHAALRDERIAAVIMLDPPLPIWNTRLETSWRTRGLGRRLLLGSTWRKALRGDVTLATYMEVARTLSTRAARAPLHACQRIGASPQHESRADPLDGLFDDLRDRGQQALLVMTNGNPAQEWFAAKSLLGCADRWPNLELQTVETSAPPQTLTPLWLQRKVHDVVDGALERELDRARQRTSSASV